jgi:hypothetical protein
MVGTPLLVTAALPDGLLACFWGTSAPGPGIDYFWKYLLVLIFAGLGLALV